MKTCDMHGRLLLCTFLLGACGSTGVEDLQGGWSGKIICLGDTSDLSLGVLVDQGAIRGTSQIRTKGSNANYEISGSQATLDRLAECTSTPECTLDRDCTDVIDQNNKRGNSRCQQGLCLPCYESKQQRQVLITLRHGNPGIPYPQLELWRFGDRLLEGTIKSFCSDEARQTPQVSVTKQ